MPTCKVADNGLVKGSTSISSFSHGDVGGFQPLASLPCMHGPPASIRRSGAALHAAVRLGANALASLRDFKPKPARRKASNAERPSRSFQTGPRRSRMCQCSHRRAAYCARVAAQKALEPLQPPLLRPLSSSLPLRVKSRCGWRRAGRVKPNSIRRIARQSRIPAALARTSASLRQT